MRPPCPSCHNPMSEVRLACDGHTHPMFVCLCGREVVIYNIKFEI